jgi:hypothetical protein
MLNRWSVLVLVVGALAGYTVAGSSAQAQSEPLPFAVGDTITLHYGNDADRNGIESGTECTVAEIRGMYVKCGRRSRVGGGSDRLERWLTLKYVVQITRRES